MISGRAAAGCLLRLHRLPHPLLPAPVGLGRDGAYLPFGDRVAARGGPRQEQDFLLDAGARFKRFMICVTRARVTWPRRARSA